MKKKNMCSMPVVDRDWEVEEAARTLRKAFEIKQDKALARKAQAKLMEEQKALNKAIADIKKSKGLK